MAAVTSCANALNAFVYIQVMLIIDIGVREEKIRGPKEICPTIPTLYTTSLISSEN